MLNKLSLSIKFYLLDSGSKKEKYPVYCRITINRKKTEFNTHKLVVPNKWDEGKQRPKGSPELSAYFTTIEKDLNSFHTSLITEGKQPTAKDLKQIYFGGDGSKVQFLVYFNQVIDDMELLPEYTKATVKKYQTIERHLKSFLDGIGNKDIKLKDIDLALVNQIDLYLKTVAKLNVNTTTKYLKQIKAIFNRGIQFGLIETNPFALYKFKHERTNRTFLTDSEVKSLNEFEIDNDSLIRVKNVFLFSVYSGLRYSDVAQLIPSDIITDKEGNQWIEISEIQKTGDAHRIPLLDRAKDIIGIYKEEAQITNKLLPVISNQKMNAYLKVVADLCGIEKKLSFHVARHTFATTITLSNDVPIEIVSKMLGHKDIATTQVYAKITNQYMKSTADMLNKKLK